jgi:ribosomal protein S18 acetylase RimI-like enzyme
MAAFSDYAQDASHVTENLFAHRALKSGVNYELSAGIFAENKMVGFTLVGLDDFEGRKSAFDAGTGIIQPFRGQGLAKAMFEYIVPKLKQMDVKQFLLEVLQVNEAAIRAYQKSGFQISRELDSFHLDFENFRFPEPRNPAIEINRITAKELRFYVDCLDWTPSWENSFASITRVQEDVKILEARKQGERAGFLAYFPMTNWILNIAVQPTCRRKGIGHALLAHLVESLEGEKSSLKIINVQHSDPGMIQFLETVGFNFVFNQFEMQMDL